MHIFGPHFSAHKKLRHKKRFPFGDRRGDRPRAGSAFFDRLSLSYHWIRVGAGRSTFAGLQARTTDRSASRVPGRSAGGSDGPSDPFLFLVRLHPSAVLGPRQQPRARESSIRRSTSACTRWPLVSGGRLMTTMLPASKTVRQSLTMAARSCSGCCS